MRHSPTRTAAIACAASFVAVVAHAQAVQPGEWETTHRIVSMEGRTLPPAIAEAMQRPTTARDCVTPERAARALQSLVKGDGDCQPKRSSLAGGVLDAEFVCTRDGGPLTISAKGPFTPTSYSLDFVLVHAGAKPSTTRMHFDAKRVGSCP